MGWRGGCSARRQSSVLGSRCGGHCGQYIAKTSRRLDHDACVFFSVCFSNVSTCWRAGANIRGGYLQGNHAVHQEHKLLLDRRAAAAAWDVDSCLLVFRKASAGARVLVKNIHRWYMNDCSHRRHRRELILRRQPVGRGMFRMIKKMLCSLRPCP